MPDPERVDVVTHASPLSSQEKSERAKSFGGVASDYQRYRPGPPVAAVDWFLPARVERAVDLGAGTGALSRLLMDRAQEVVAVEPDDRMRGVLTEEIPGIRAVAGKGESMALPDGCSDAVLASSSWHWMDPLLTLHEVGRVLVPGGVLGVLWSGPDPEGPFLRQAQAALAAQSSAGALVAGTDGSGGSGGSESDGSELASVIMGEAQRPQFGLEIPVGVPFDQPEHETFTWDVALNADDLIGLLGTFSWIITMPEQTRQRVVAQARRMLGEFLGVEGDVTIDVAFRCDAFRSRRHD